MVHKRDLSELEKRGIFSFVSASDRDIAVREMRKAGYYAEPLGEAMMVASKSKSKISKIKSIEKMLRKTLGKMVEKGQVIKKDKKYELAK